MSQQQVSLMQMARTDKIHMHVLELSFALMLFHTLLWHMRGQL